MEVDPYKILNVSKNFTIEELRQKYKQICLQVHPDKGGSEQLFEMVTYCYEKLLKHYFKKQEREHHELKHGYDRFVEKEQSFEKLNPFFMRHQQERQLHQQSQYQPSQQQSQQSPYQSQYQHHPQHKQPPQQSQQPQQSSRSSESTMRAFHEAFEKNRMQSAMDVGYGAQMQQSYDGRETRELNVDRTLDKFTSESFNQAFERNVPLSAHQTQVSVYKPPEAQMLAKRIQFSELGVEDMDDFSGKSGNGNLLYTDYMRAHTTQRLVDPRMVSSRPEFANVEQYVQYREQNNTMTEDENRAYHEMMEEEKMREAKRRRAQKDYDKLAEQRHARFEQAMLSHR
jgi:hypothetical protein